MIKHKSLYDIQINEIKSLFDSSPKKRYWFKKCF